MKNLKMLSLIAAAALSVGVLAGCGTATATVPSTAVSSTAAASVSGQAADGTSDTVTDAAAVSVNFTVTDKDGNAVPYTLTGEQGDTLADALLSSGLISEEEAAAGFVTTVNGITADYDADGAWWMLVDKDGNMTNDGIADITPADGDSYGFVYTVG